MSRKRVQPTRITKGTIPGDRYEETHPAYAMIGASRVSSMPGEYLAGSDFQHRNFVVIAIARASRERGISHDWWHAEGTEIIEVAVSEAQWATFVSTMNVGHGTPCTIQREGVNLTPGILPIENRREEFHVEVSERLQSVITSLQQALAQAKTKAQRSPIETALRNLTANMAYEVEQFDEHAEKTVEHAKVEVEAYLTAAIQRAGLTALKGQAPIALPGEVIGRVGPEYTLLDESEEPR